MVSLFTKTCKCGGTVFGPRVGGKAGGKWLGYNTCLKCREAEQENKS